MARKFKDITAEVADAKKASEGQHDPWQDYINWKAIRNEGYDAVVIDESGPLSFTKFGPLIGPAQ